MPSHRIVPALGIALLIPIWAWAQGPAPSTPAASAPGAAAKAAPAPPPAPPTEAEKTIDAAIKKVEALKSVSADIEQKVDMLGQTFKVKGQYLRAPGYRMKLLLILSGLGDAKGRMQQVCDGNILWDFSQVLDSQSCRKLSILPVMQRLQSPDCDAQIREGIISQLGFSGPDALLSGLRKACAFNQQEEGTLDGKKVWILRGEWKDRAALNGPGQPPLPAIGPLPPYVTSIVELSLGQEDGWPYRVQLAGKPMLGPMKGQQQMGPDGRPIGAKVPVQKEKPSKIVLTYANVNLDPKLSAADFAFQPPEGVSVLDGTQKITTELDTLLAEMSARKKQAADSTSGPVLDQSIPVPKTPTDPTAASPKP